MTGTFSRCSLRSGSVCRAVLAAARPGGQEAGVGGKSGPAAQHWPGRGRGGHPLQDGVPSGQQVRGSLVCLGINRHDLIFFFFLSVFETFHELVLEPRNSRPNFLLNNIQSNVTGPVSSTALVL